VQIFLIGLLGEYVGAILTQVRHRPIVVEQERFDSATVADGTPDKEGEASRPAHPLAPDRTAQP